MLSQGSLVKKLRLERRISQEKLCQGITSRSTLSSFEIRNTNLSSQSLFKYLDRMNITPHEFELLLNQNEYSQKKIDSQEFYHYFYNDKLSSYLLESTLKKYKETGDFFYYSMYTQGLLLKNREDFDKKKTKYKSFAREIQNYLFRVETWGKFELNMFSNLLFIFNEETVNSYLDTELNKALMYNNDPLYTNLLTVTILNGCTYACEKKNIKLLSRFLNILKSMPKNPSYFYLRAHLSFYEEILKYLKTGTLNFTKLRETLDFFEENDYSNHKNDLEDLIVTINKY